jgi:hypothetical protein
MKKISNKMEKMVKTIPATLIILASFIGISKGEKSNKVSRSEVNVMNNTTKKSALKNEDWGSAMTAGWAMHIIRHTSLF